MSWPALLVGFLVILAAATVWDLVEITRQAMIKRYAPRL
jgi:hypothetical protein